MPNSMTKPGLTSEEARARLVRYGPNELPKARRGTLFRRFLRQFQSPLIYILLLAVFVDLLIWWFEGATGVPYESIAIAAILLLNTALGMYQEGKSEAALARLKEMAAPLAWVRRDGKLVHIPAAELVPGDVVHLEAGDRVPADGLLDAEGILVDESVITGESLPVEKNRGDELLSGTLLMRGKAELELTRIGLPTGVTEDPDHPGWYSWGDFPKGSFAAATGRLLFRPDGPGRGTCRMFPTERHQNMGGSLHGGAVMSFIDMALFEDRYPASNLDMFAFARLADGVDAAAARANRAAVRLDPADRAERRVGRLFAIPVDGFEAERASRCGKEEVLGHLSSSPVRMH